MIATEFVTYLWHYMTARLLYDEFVRPLANGHLSAPMPMVAVAIAAFAAGRLTRRRT